VPTDTCVDSLNIVPIGLLQGVALAAECPNRLIED
jgi:hypothetical protein